MTSAVRYTPNIPILLVPPTPMMTAAVRMRIGVLVLRRCRTAARYRRRLLLLLLLLQAAIRCAHLGRSASRRLQVTPLRRLHIAVLHGGGRSSVTGKATSSAALVVGAGLVATMSGALPSVLAMRTTGAARHFALVVGRATSLVPVPAGFRCIGIIGASNTLDGDILFARS